MRQFRNDGTFRDVYGLDLAHERKMCAMQVTLYARSRGLIPKILSYSPWNIESNADCQEQSTLHHFPNQVLMDVTRAGINHYYPRNKVYSISNRKLRSAM